MSPTPHAPSMRVFARAHDQQRVDDSCGFRGVVGLRACNRRAEIFHPRVRSNRRLVRVFQVGFSA
jgi:hypothetical protein